MFKKLLNLIKINKGDNTEKEAIEVDKVEQLTTDENIGNDKVEELVEEDINENNETKNDTEKEIEVIDSIENDNNEISIIEKELDTIETVDNTDYENINTKDIIAENKKESVEGNVEIDEPTDIIRVLTIECSCHIHTLRKKNTTSDIACTMDMIKSIKTRNTNVFQ